MTDKVVVLMTCGTRREAKRIASRLVERRLAACVNVLETPMRSTYRWKGRVETAAEYLLLVKTARELLSALRSEVERMHSYEVPEVIALPIVGGSAVYLRWLGECLGPARRMRHRGTETQRTKK
jgi:periplasmic divalent cation tolerance protein